MMQTNFLDDLAQIDFPMRDFWVGAAKFHFDSLSPALGALAPGARVLEIGCGAGILMTMLNQEFPDLEMEGIEPLGDGFGSLSDLRDYMTERGVKVHNAGYEGFEPDGPYELVYLVNVLEHLPDWRHFFDTLPRFLKPGGRCLFLCPNYDVPFDPHFNRPVFGSKAFMTRFYRRRIERIETEFDMAGLWDSINFVRLSQIKAHLADKGWTLTVHHSVSDRMINRLITDDAMSEHMGLARVIGRVLSALKVTKLVSRPRFENYQPYIFVELSGIVPPKGT